MSYDTRYNNYHIVNRDITDKWSTDLSQFPGIPHAFAFEKALVPYGDDIQQFTIDYSHYSFYISIVYLITIFSLKKWMDTREKGFNLRRYLTAWNVFLALFSIFGVIRCLPEFIHVLYNEGVRASFSKASYYTVS